MPKPGLTLGRAKRLTGSLMPDRRGFEGGLTNRKYAGIAHVSRATAQRELADLVKKGILRPNPAGDVVPAMIWFGGEQIKFDSYSN